MNQVTTRRVIKPSGGVKPPEPLNRQPNSPSAALQPKKPTLWASWLERFAKVEQFSAGLAAETELIRAKPRLADVTDARRLQDHYLTPWTELLDTFDAAAGAQVSDCLRADYRAYLELRTALIRSLIRRCLAPSDAAVAQLDAAKLALQQFVDARRNRA